MVAVPAFPSYAAGARTDLERNAERLRGARLRQMAFIPDRPGSLIVLPIAFSWFDPEFGRYRVQRSDSIVVRVAPAPAGAPLNAERTRSASAVPAPPRAGTSTGTAGGEPIDGWPPRPPLFVGAASLVGYAGWGFLTLRRRRAARDPRRRRFALLGAALEAIERAAGDPGALGAAEDVGNALRESAGLRCDVDLEGRARRNVVESLRAAGMAEDEVSELSSILLRLDETSFAPGAAATLSGLAEEARRLVRRWHEECRP